MVIFALTYINAKMIPSTPKEIRRMRVTPRSSPKRTSMRAPALSYIKRPVVSGLFGLVLC